MSAAFGYLHAAALGLTESDEEGLAQATSRLHTLSASRGLHLLRVFTDIHAHDDINLYDMVNTMRTSNVATVTVMNLSHLQQCACLVGADHRAIHRYLRARVIVVDPLVHLPPDAPASSAPPSMIDLRVFENQPVLENQRGQSTVEGPTIFDGPSAADLSTEGATVLEIPSPANDSAPTDNTAASGGPTMSVDPSTSDRDDQRDVQDISTTDGTAMSASGAQATDISDTGAADAATSDTAGTANAPSTADHDRSEPDTVTSASDLPAPDTDLPDECTSTTDSI